MNRQEMLTRAVLGLSAQGWERSTDSDGFCSYDNGQGRRCAWGHVDTSLTGISKFGEGTDSRSLTSLRLDGVGLAALLSEEDMLFAQGLQACHDKARSPEGMQEQFRSFASQWGLTFPEAP